MILSEHDSVTCDNCGAPMWYSLKEEPTGWKVFYVCDPSDGCGLESRLGNISMADVASKDEAYERAEEMGERR